MHQTAISVIPYVIMHLKLYALLACVLGSLNADDSLTSVTITAYNYNAAVLYSSSSSYIYAGGAAIISSYYIVTTATCVSDYTYDIVYVRIGSSLYSSGGTIYSLEALSKHPYYDSSTHDFDIAVLKLSVGLSVGSSVGTIGLPTSGASVSIVDDAVLTSWGGLSNGCLAAAQLGYINVSTISASACQSTNTALYLSDRMFCADYTARSDGACIGDTGSPLVIDSQLVGILSYHYGGDLPVIFSGISQYIDWINSVISGVTTTTAATTTTTTTTTSSPCSCSSDNLISFISGLAQVIVDYILNYVENN